MNEGSQVMLDGSESCGPDAEALTYGWTQISGPVVTLTQPTSASPSFTAPPVGPGGTTLVCALVVDDGLAARPADTVTITVVNINDPPVCHLAQASPAVLWSPNHKLVAVTITGVTDPNNDQATLTITGITQDEPVNGLGDGDSSPDGTVSNAGVVLRAERAGGGNGRVYRVSFQADDQMNIGGSCTGSATVCVPHDRRATGCGDDGQVYSSQ